MFAIKTRAKNFSEDEITTLVNLVLENTSELFAAFSTKLTSNDKEEICEYIARTISQDHGTTRSKHIGE